MKYSYVYFMVASRMSILAMQACVFLFWFGDGKRPTKRSNIKLNK